MGLLGTKFFFTQQEIQRQTRFAEASAFSTLIIINFLNSTEEQFFLENNFSKSSQEQTESNMLYMLSALQSLGEFKQIASIETDTEKPMADSASTPSLLYLKVTTEFENDTGTFYIELNKEDEDWEVNSFNLISEMLIL